MKTPGSVLTSLTQYTKGTIHYLQLFQIFRNLYIIKSMSSFSLLSKCHNLCVSTIRGQGGHLGFPISLKNTNFVEDVEILLPVKFHEIPFSCFRGEVKNVSANQKPGRPSCFSDRPEKHKLGRGP